MNTKIIFFPKGGSVEKVAQKLEAKLDTKACCVEDVDYEAIATADLIIMGGSTVGADHWKNDLYKDPWTQFAALLKEKGLNLEGKKVAIYGLGNQVLYPAHFVDSIKDVADVAIGAGAELIGACSTDGYDFEASEAIADGKFIGLPLDEDTQASKTDARLDAWIASLGL